MQRKNPWNGYRASEVGGARQECPQFHLSDTCFIFLRWHEGFHLEIPIFDKEDRWEAGIRGIRRVLQEKNSRSLKQLGFWQPENSLR